jgi:hypothetical protein
MGTLSGIGHPSFFAHPSVMATHRPRSKGPGPASLLRATVRWIVPSIRESLLGKGRGCLVSGQWRDGCARVEALERRSPKRLLFFSIRPQVMPALRGLIIEPPV